MKLHMKKINSKPKNSDLTSREDATQAYYTQNPNKISIAKLDSRSEVMEERVAIKLPDISTPKRSRFADQDLTREKNCRSQACLFAMISPRK